MTKPDQVDELDRVLAEANAEREEHPQPNILPLFTLPTTPDVPVFDDPPPVPAQPSTIANLHRRGRVIE